MRNGAVEEFSSSVNGCHVLQPPRKRPASIGRRRGYESKTKNAGAYRPDH
jgi:hypothetical protein